MSLNADPENQPILPTRRGKWKGSNGSIASSRYSDTKQVPLLLEESYSSLESSLTSAGEMQFYGNDFSYVSTDTTAEAIRQCEKFILRPYSNAIKIIGWLPYRATRCGYAVQFCLVVLWFLCILATMATQALSCFRRDAFVPGKTISVSEAIIGPPVKDYNDYSLFSDLELNKNYGSSMRNFSCQHHVISSLIVPDIVVLITYFYGMLLFVRGGSDYLFSLASHVFIKNSEAQSSSNKLIGTIGFLFIFGLVWLSFSLIVRIMTSVAVQLFDDHVIIVWPNLIIDGIVKYVLLIFSLFGFLTFDALYMFAIFNYVAQGEMVIYMLWDVRRLIQLRKYDNIDGAVKDTQKCKQYVDVLNGRTATLTALALFVLIILALASIIDIDRANETMIVLPKVSKILAAISAFLNTICWCMMVCLPFIQAARVTYWCDQLKDLSPEIRARLSAAYQNDTLLDLDSLLSYLQNVRLGTSLFGVPIKPWMLYLVVVTFSFTMLILLQVDAYRIGKYI